MNTQGEFKYPNYTSTEHETWSMLFNKQMTLLPSRACSEYMEGLDKLNFSSTRIPALGDVDQVLRKTTGWSVKRVDGLVPEKEFFELLAQKQFPSTDFIRKREDLKYTPSPDMFHDLFGHMSLITNPVFARFFQLVGQAGAVSTGEKLKEVQRLYWFTVEFGLIKKNGEKRIYGSGILSSPEEVVYCLSDKVKVHPFSVKEVRHKLFDIWHLQEELYMIESFEQLRDSFEKYGRDEGLIN